MHNMEVANTVLLNFMCILVCMREKSQGAYNIFNMRILFSCPECQMQTA